MNPTSRQNDGALASMETQARDRVMNDDRRSGGTPEVSSYLLVSWN
jgi:hypothetical protein